MQRKALKLMLAFSLFFSVLLVFPFSFEWAYVGWSNAVQQNDLRVYNLNTTESYSTIQEAIDAPETLDGHKIFVSSGIYVEDVTVNKSLSLIGEDRSTTVIDGKSKAVCVTADNVEVRGFTMQSGTFGLLLDNSQNSKIINNTLRDGSYGIRLYHSKYSEVIGNVIEGYTWFGVEIDSSGNSTLRRNSMSENEYNFGVNGNSLSDFINDIDVSNIVNGKPIRYLINQHNITIDSFTFQEMGYLGLVNSTHVNVKEIDVQGNVQGILFAFTKNSIINNVNAEHNWNGIYVAHSSNISVVGNNANSNFDYGIKFFNSSRSIASGNNVDSNWAGIGLFSSPNSEVEGNEANFNTYDLHMVYTNNSVIVRNNALTKGGGYSIAVYYSHNNLIYRNTFVNSYLHAETRNGTSFIPRNSWDNGLEGNYWRFYTGGDVDPLDGIGDTSYVIGENNVDNHPLIGRFSDFTVTLGEKSYSISLISNSSISQFHFSSDDGRISLQATGERGTVGFLRIGVPNAFLQDLPGGNLSVLINGEQPVLKREWTDGTHTYFYFTYVNSISESGISPWLIAAVASILLTVSILVVWKFKKRLRMRAQKSN